MYFETSFSIDFCFSRSIKFKYLSLESLEVKSNSQYLRKGSFILFKIALPIFFLKMLLSLFSVKKCCFNLDLN